MDNPVEEPSGSPSSSQTPTAPTDAVPPFEWIFQNRRPHPFITETSGDGEVETKNLMVFDVRGIVTSAYLRPDAFSHSVSLQLSADNIEEIKAIIRTAPGHKENNFRCPFEDMVAKFTSKDSKDALTREFEPVLDGRDVDLRNFTGVLQDLQITDVVEGTQVVLEYTPVPFPGKKARGTDEGFAGGCTLKLHSITVVAMNAPTVVFQTGSPSKRRRVQ